jgi:formylglycine-generating enzyme required for sulfatase activity
MENQLRRVSLKSPMRLACAALVLPLAAVACSGQGGEPVKEPPSAPPSCAKGTAWDGKTCAAITPPGASESKTAETASGASGASTNTSGNAPATPEPAPKAAAACPEGMVLVPGGSFKMELRKDPVTVAPVCMDVTEVTADQYAACVKSGKCSASNLKCAAEATFEAADKGNHPIVCVDFNQAVSYCAAQNKRLPSDEEWEWAARGGAEGRAFPWGNNTPKDQLCWSGVRTRNGTCAVGSMPAGDNPQGIHDLAGNVFEWTTTKNDPRTKVRVGRGGSWKDGIPELMRAARPGGFEVTYRCGFLGIRCVTEASASAGEPAASPAVK